MKRWSLVILALLVALSGAARASEAPTVEARGAVLIDGDSGRILFGQNENERFAMASTTKIMTALLVLEAIDEGKLSLSDSIDTDSDGNSLSLIDVLADEEDMSERVVQTDLCQHLSQLIDNVLDEREAEILRLRYGLNGDAALTQRETARRCGISRSYVSRLEKKALEKLKRKLEEE